MSEEKKLGLALTANDKFVQDIGKALRVPASVLLQVANYVNTATGIRISDTEKLLTIWKKSSLSSDDLSSALSVLKHLFEEAIKKKVSIETLLQEISEFCAERNIPGFDERKDALGVFLTPKPEFLRRLQFVDFEAGVVPALEAISGVVQLRAAFSDKSSTEITGYVPIVEIRLRAEDAATEKEESFAFQVDEPGLKKLLKYLKEYEDQLGSMKKAVESKLEVYTPAEEEESK
jgi:hypothetical protein